VALGISVVFAYLVFGTTDMLMLAADAPYFSPRSAACRSRGTVEKLCSGGAGALVPGAGAE
jgi:hypothetical protein